MRVIPRILCVEDDAETCLMLTHLLGQQGWAVSTVESVKEALPLARRESFDLYILDSWLPEESGISLCQKIREFDTQTPIIIYSGAAYDSDRQVADKAGADAFVAKPHIGQLIETIRRLLKADGSR